jgi:hypothetical protein
MAFGNSDSDFERLEWTTRGEPGRVSTRRRFGPIVHHPGAEHEWACDRDSHVGRLSKGLDEAPKSGRVVADMKKDCKRIFSLTKE